MNLVERAKNIIVTPKTEWGAVAAEEPNIQQILLGYVLPLALIPTIAVIIGWGQSAYLDLLLSPTALLWGLYN